MSDGTRRWIARIFGVSLLVGSLWTHSATVAHASHPINTTAFMSAPHRTSRRTVSPVRPTDAVICLAQTLFFEAHHEPLDAMQAVAATVFNRMDSHLYPRTVCAVVYQAAQYSWTSDVRKWAQRPPDTYMQLAKTFIHDRDDIEATFPVTHFHRIDVHPRWASTYALYGQLGQQLFYSRE